MTKADIIDRIANGTGLTKIETEAVINGLITTVKDALLEGERVDLRGFGAFQVQYRAPRIARNPQTNKEIPLDAQYIPVFKASKELRQAVDAAQKAAAHQS